jgi:hypothetical protein
MKTPETKTPTIHWASSDAPGGKCWCGEQASPEHATVANKSPRNDSADPPTKGWRQG